MSEAVFVSPHLDDAVLSCAGGIARLVGSGVEVTVVSVFTADQPPGAQLSRLARRMHASWGAGDQPFAVRRAEDLEALGLLGAHAEHLGLLDAMYRRSSAGDPLYTNPLATVAPEDAERLLPALAKALEGSRVSAGTDSLVFCPAGTGGHVDHVLVRRAVEQLVGAERIVYYDEYPYNSRPGAETTDADPSGRALGTLQLTAGELDARVTAIGHYTSQLRGLFPSTSERLLEIASARLPIVGPKLVRPVNPTASRARTAARVRDDAATLGGERYRSSSSGPSPFPAA